MLWEIKRENGSYDLVEAADRTALAAIVGDSAASGAAEWDASTVTTDDADTSTATDDDTHDIGGEG